MLQRSIYLQGQKTLGHWGKKRESKFQYLAISTKPSRHTHNAGITQCTKVGNMLREATLWIKSCSKSSFWQPLFAGNKYNHGTVWLSELQRCSRNFSSKSSRWGTPLHSLHWALQLTKLTPKLEVLLFLMGNAFFNNGMPEETLIFAVSFSALVL